jgi:Concanavalin A-like lectin/glucanases superfamily
MAFPSGTITAQRPDPSFSNVHILLRGDAANGTTTYTDSSSFNYTITRNGTTNYIDESQKKYGRSSIFLPAVTTAGYLTSDDTFPAFGNTDLTIELWIYPQSAVQMGICDFRQASGENEPFISYNANNSIRLNVDNAQRFNSGALSLNTWHHIAASRNTKVWRFFINGTQIGTTYTDGTSFARRRLTLGSYVDQRNTSTGFHTNGYVDDFRLTIGVGRYTASFTPPLDRYPDR